MTELITDPMVLAIALPAVGGFLCLLLPRSAELSCAVLTVVVCAASAGLIARLCAGPERLLELAGMVSLRLDALSVMVLLATAVFGVLIAIYSVTWMAGRAGHRAYFVYFLWTLAAAFGAVLANDLFTFLGCWGFLALTLYLMIGVAGPAAADSARKSLMIVGGADALLVLGAVLLWGLTGTTRMDVTPVPVNGATATIAFACFIVAAFAKAGAMPLHSWVPDCGERAYVPVVAFLPASLDKLVGVYLLARVCGGLFEPTPGIRVVLMLLGALTIVAAAMMALVQQDLKRLLAYCTVSQVGYMILGIASGSAVGFAGGLFHMLNHAVYKSALFLCAGAMEQTCGTTDLDRLGGLNHLMPVTFGAFLVAALSVSGIPPLNGFVSKWMVYQGVIEAAATVGPVWIVCLAAAMLGLALTLAGFAKALHAAFLAKPSPSISGRGVGEVGVVMLVPMVLLAAVCVVFGVFASAVPLRWLVLPVVPAEPEGVWWSGAATLFLLIAIAAGLVIYRMTMGAGRLRRVETYVGGERLDEVYIRGEAPGNERHVEVTGVDFFDTFERHAGLAWAYQLARRGAFDIYRLGHAATSYVVALLGGEHSARSPVYLMWFMAGVVAVVYALTRTGGLS